VRGPRVRGPRGRGETRVLRPPGGWDQLVVTFTSGTSRPCAGAVGAVGKWLSVLVSELDGGRGSAVGGGGARAGTDAAIAGPSWAVPLFHERKVGCSPPKLDGPAEGIVR
jgi:hypothetical protein